MEFIPDDGVLNNYLLMAGKEILSWIYGSSGVPVDDDGCEIPVPHRYDLTQINAVLVGMNLIGAEGQTTHDENGVKRSFSYPTMVNFIRRNVIPKGKVI
jgi:hypothetical protein